jgi:hypothetical protein
LAVKPSTTKKYEYRKFGGSFPNQDKLLEALNDFGADGWRVIKLDTSVGTTAFMVVWLEREIN